MKIGIIIQARSDSRRFPKKIFQLIEKKPMLWHVVERCKWMKLPIIVSTTDRKIDDDVELIANSCEVNCFRGSTDDVLDRFYKTAKEFALDIIVRITADCPLIDPKQSLKVIDLIKSSNLDYVSFDETFPDGLDTEVLTFDSLEKSWIHARLKSEREHVTPYIYKNKNHFKIKKISYEKDLKNFRWTVDYPDDLEFIRKIFSELYHGKIFFMEDILKLLEINVELNQINKNHVRNEEYAKSIEKENE